MKMYSTIMVAVLALIMGSVIGYLAMLRMPSHVTPHNTRAANPNDKPLYWVAPMDPNYQRDKPGKSPMGMDLIPIYPDKSNSSSKSDKKGTVTIEPAVENNLGVKTAAVIRQILTPQIKTIGYIDFDASKLWQINLRVSGWVKKWYFSTVGEKVTRGDILFTFYSPELIKAQEELLNAYNHNRSELVTGAKLRLLAMGVDDVQIKHILTTKKITQTIDIKAPESGIITNINVREGGYLAPSQTAMSAGSIDDIWVNVELFEHQIAWIKQSTPAKMTLTAIANQQWQGTVDYIYPILDPKMRTLRARLKFANHDGTLKPNMFANIILQPDMETPVLTIPSQAIIHADGIKRVVLSEGRGKYRSTKVTVGREVNDRTEIITGLTTNDRVVISAQFLIDSESNQTADLSRISGKQEQLTGDEGDNL